VRDLAPSERPRERLAKVGPEALRDAELLAVLFRTGTRELGAVALADRLLGHFGSLRHLARASLEEVQQVKGVGEVKAIEIKAALELGKRLATHIDGPRPRIKGSEDVANLLMAYFKECEREEFKVLLMNQKNEVIKSLDISVGSTDATIVLPREVYRQAVREATPAVIVCHNHPSGDPEPSRADIQITRRLEEGADLLGIRLVDHVVFGDGRYVSFKDRGLLQSV
jgi:DNA repair protein RadC